MKKRFLSILMSGLMLLSSIQVQAQDIDTTMYKFNTMDNLVVSIPSNIDLSYSSGRFRGEDVVKVEGFRSSSKEYTVDISLDTTSVVYTDGSNSLNGLVSFGSDGVGSWTASEVADGVEKEISIDLIDLPDTEGTYTGSFDYNIKVTKTLIDEGYFTKVVNSDGVTCTITGLTNKGKEWVRSKNGVLDIPDTKVINGVEYTVNALGLNAFKGNTDIKLVNIASTVETVGVSSFQNCTSLVSLNFNDNSQIRVIDEFAFCDSTSLVNVELPEGLEEIRHFAFMNCKIRDLVIPDSCSMLRIGAFYGMDDSLRSLKMPIDCNFVNSTAGNYTSDSATLSAAYAFKGSCDNLVDITLTKGKTGIGIDLNETTCDYTPWNDGYTSSKWYNVTFEDGITRIGNYYFNHYLGIQCNKLEFNASDSRLTIGNRAFGKTDVKNIIWNVKDWYVYTDSFYDFCFDYFDDYQTVLNIGDNTTHIPAAMTYGYNGRVGIDYVNWGNSPSLTIYSQSFRGTTLKEILLPKSITTIPSEAFYSTTATVISVPNTVTHVDSGAFGMNQELKDIYWDAPDAVINGSSRPIFYEVGSKYDTCTLHFGDTFVERGITDVPLGLFNDPMRGVISAYATDIRYVDWGNWKPTNLGLAFRNSNIYEIHIPDSIITIKASDFYSTSDLHTIYFEKTLRNIEEDAFESSGVDVVVYNGTKSYKEANLSIETAGNSSLINATWIYLEEEQNPTDIFNITYNTDNTCVINGLTTYGTGYLKGNNGALEIPSEVTKDGVKYLVVSIGAEAFRGNTDLISVVMEEGIKKIGYYAFESCTNLKTVKLANSITDMGQADVANADVGGCIFWKCSSLESVNIPASLTVIPRSCFGYCTSLKTIEIPDSVDVLGYQAFAYSGLTSVSIPDGAVVGQRAFMDSTALEYINLPKSVTSVGVDAFTNSGLKTVNYEGYRSDRALITVGSPNTEFENAYWIYAGVQTQFAVDGVLYEVDWDTNTAVCLGIADSSLNSITIKGSLNIEGTNVPVKSIQANAFDGNTVLTSVVVEEGVESVGYYAFQGCSNLQTVRLANSITDMGQADVANVDAGGCIFWQCTSLTSVNIPAGVSIIPRSCFGYCSSLSSIEIPDTVDYIGYQAFRNTALATVSIPADTVVSELAFASCTSLVSVDMPASVYLKGEAFRNSDNTSMGVFDRCTALQSVVVPSANPVVGADMFYGCTSLNDITFEAGITTIGQAAVYGCTSLKTVTFKSGVTTIKKYAFYGCSTLNQIYLPVSLKTVETYAFYNCSSLTNGYIYYTGTSSNKSSISVASNNNPFKNSNWVYSSAVVLSLRKPVYELVAYDEAINMIALEKTVLTDEIEGAVIAEVNVDDILLAQGYALVDGAESDWLYVTDSNDYCGYVNKQYLSILETEEAISYEKNAFDSAIEMTVLSDTSVLVEPDGEEIFEVLSGELIVIHGSVVIDGSESDWYYTEFETGEIGMIRKEFLSEVTDEVLEEKVEEPIEEVPTVSDNSLDTESEKVSEDLENISDMSSEDEILTDSEHIEVSSDEVSNDEILNEVDSPEELISDGVNAPEDTLSDVPNESDSSVLEVQDNLSSDGVGTTEDTLSDVPNESDSAVLEVQDDLSSAGVDLIEEEVILQEGGEPLNEDIPDVDINEDYIVSSSEEEDVVESDTE